MSEDGYPIQAYNVGGAWISADFAEELILLVREALQWYGSFTDAQIMVALDIKSACPAVAAMFLEGFMTAVTNE